MIGERYLFSAGNSVSLAIIKQGQISVQRRACLVEISEDGDFKLVNSMTNYYPYFIVSWPDFRISKIEGSPSANFALQPTNSLEKPNHHPTDL